MKKWLIAFLIIVIIAFIILVLIIQNSIDKSRDKSREVSFELCFIGDIFKTPEEACQDSLNDEYQENSLNHKNLENCTLIDSGPLSSPYYECHVKYFCKVKCPI